MHNEVIKKTRIDSRPRDFQGFYDHVWARQIGKRVSSHSRLSQTIGELLMAWKSSSNAFRSFWLLANLSQITISSFVKERPAGSEQLLNALIQRVRLRRPDNFQADMIKILADELFDAKLQCDAERSRFLEDFSVQNVWKQYIHNQEIQLAIEGMKLQTYSAIVFAYEYFILNVIRIVGEDEELDPRGANAFAKELLLRFDDSDFVDKIWKSPYLAKARSIRNSIAHTGGKIKDDDRQYESEDGIYHCVMADDINSLYLCLQNNVDEIVKRVMS